jgi:DNA-binding transcriptional MerR regulator
MRISELAERTGVPVATIKYYLREGLLPPGRKVSERLSEYDESHVRRLGLLRILRVIGDVPVEKLRAIVEASRDAGSVHDMLAVAARVIAPTPSPGGPDRAGFRQAADQLIEQAGWTDVDPAASDRENLAVVLEAIVAHGTHEPDPALAATYLDFADRLAAWEVGNLDAGRSREEILEEMIVGEVVFGQLFMVLRRLAHEHHSKARFGA